jgi:hypothetical protein
VHSPQQFAHQSLATDESKDFGQTKGVRLPRLALL